MILMVLADLIILLVLILLANNKSDLVDYLVILAKIILPAEVS